MPLGSIPTARLTGGPPGSFVSPELPGGYYRHGLNHEESNPAPVSPDLDQRGGFEPPFEKRRLEPQLQATRNARHFSKGVPLPVFRGVEHGPISFALRRVPIDDNISERNKDRTRQPHALR